MGEGRFIVLDGVDGCGKSTQARLLTEALQARREPALHVREPGSTGVGERLRELILSREYDLDAGVEALLLLAARRQMLREVVAPALERGEHVVCERFHSSTFAYQAVAGGLGEPAVLELFRWAASPEPDHLVLLELSPDEAQRRAGPAGDRIEARGVEFQREVAAGYRRYAEVFPGTLRVDASGSPEEVQARIQEVIFG